MIDSSTGKQDDLASKYFPPTVLSSPETANETTRAADSVPVEDGIFQSLPTQFGRYHVERRLGQGAMGAVYLARDTQLDRLVALKIPRLSTSSVQAMLRRLKREAQVVAKFEHPNIGRVYDQGEQDGIHFIAMEYVDGDDLKSKNQKTGRKLAPDAAVLLIRRLLQIVAVAHEHGIVHRDLKPENIMIRRKDGEPVILDFGLAKFLEPVTADAGQTQDGSVVGTAAYMSPEQAMGTIEEIDARSDIYSLGAMLFEMLTGRWPFLGRAIDVMGQKTHCAAPSPLEFNPSLPPQLAAVCQKMIAKNQDDRFATCEKAIDALDAVDLGDFPMDAVETYPLDVPVQPSGNGDIPIDNRAGGIADSRAGMPPETASRQITSSPPEGSSRNGRRPVRHWMLAAGGAMLMTLAAVVFFQTPYGVFQIDIEDPTLSVRFDGSSITIDNDGQPIRVTPRVNHHLEVLQNGVTIDSATRELAVSRGKTRRIRITLKDGEVAIDGTKVAPGPAANVSVDKPPERVQAKQMSPLQSLRRDQIPIETLTLAGRGDPLRVSTRIVGALGEPIPIQTQAVLSVTFSPNGKWLATGSADNTIILWDAHSGVVNRFLLGHQGPVSSVAFSKDSQTLLSASHDGTIKLWPTEQAADPESLQPELGEIAAVAVSSDGRFLAAGGSKGPIKLWKWGQWLSPVEIGMAENGVTALAFSPDGEMLASGWNKIDSDTAIRIYNTADATLDHTMSGHTRRIYSLVFNRTGKLLASTGGYPQLRFWNTTSGKLTNEVIDIAEGFGAASSVQFGPDETTAIFTMLGGPRLLTYDLATRTVSTLEGAKEAQAVAISPDHQLIAVGSFTGGLNFLETKNWQSRYFAPGHRHFVNMAVFSPDGRTIFSSGDDATVRQWDLQDVGKNRVFRNFKDSAGLLACSPDGKSFAAAGAPAGHGYWANVSDSVTGKELVRLDPLISHLIYALNSNSVIAGRGNYFGPGQVCLWDLGLGKEVHRFPGEGIWHALELNTDGTSIAGVDLHTNTLKVWDVAGGHENRNWNDAFSPNKEFMPAAAIRSDLGLLAVGHDDGMISLWDMAARKKKHTLTGHSGRIRMLKFTRDGTTLVSTGHDGTIRLWNPEVLRSRDVIPLGPPNAAWDVQIDPSGQYAVVTGQCPVVFILNIALAP